VRWRVVSASTPPARRPPLVLLTALTVVATLAATCLSVGATARPVAAQAAPVVIGGGGWCHARGLSQWGSHGFANSEPADGAAHGRCLSQWRSLGYAIGDHGDGVAHAPWSASQILAHYYGGTTAGTVSPAQPISVDIQRHAGGPIAAEVDAGNVVATAPSGS